MKTIKTSYIPIKYSKKQYYLTCVDIHFGKVVEFRYATLYGAIKLVVKLPLSQLNQSYLIRSGKRLEPYTLDQVRRFQGLIHIIDGKTQYDIVGDEPFFEY